MGLFTRKNLFDVPVRPHEMSPQWSAQQLEIAAADDIDDAAFAAAIAAGRAAMTERHLSPLDLAA